MSQPLFIRSIPKLLERFRKGITAYGPGIFILGAIIGTGSVSSLVWAGAEHGMELLWALLLSCAFFWVLIQSISRLTFASGKTFVGLAKQHFGPVGAFYIVLAVVVSQFTSNIGVLGIVSEAFASWTGMDIWISSLIWVTLVYALIVTGKYSAFEKILIVFVTLLGFSFIFNVLIARPSVGSIVSGLVPRVPEGGAMITGAMVGTTLAGSVVVMRSYLVHDKGWSLQDLRHANNDALVSSASIFVVSAIIMACAAATLYVRNLHVENAIDMAYTLEPLMGNLAASLFVVGIVAAGLSSAFANALVSIWTLRDFAGQSRDASSLSFRLLALPFCLAGLIAPAIGGKPVLLQIMSLALQAIFLPVLVIFLMILANKVAVIGEHKNTAFINTMTVITLVFSFFMAYQAFLGLSGLLG